MPIDLSLIKTIVVVMMENRSFDHMLGYLSLDPYNWQVEGLGNTPAWRDQASSVYGTSKYPPFETGQQYDLLTEASKMQVCLFPKMILTPTSSRNLSFQMTKK